jgi:Heterokaryon incompatibility protein (HET)
MAKNHERDHVYEVRGLPLQSIRILELLPGSRGEPRRAGSSLNPSKEHPYEAISYVWENPERKYVIRCDWKTLGVTANLLEALTAFRREDATRRLWIDIYCNANLKHSASSQPARRRKLNF